MAKYRKKPIIVDAWQWNGLTLAEAILFFTMNNIGISPVIGNHEGMYGLIIYTKEGSHVAQQGDFIIKGIAGEFYPCKPDIFAATYECINSADEEVVMEKIQQALEAVNRLLKNAYPFPRQLSGPIFDAETVRDCLNILSKLNETACETDTYIPYTAREVLTNYQVEEEFIEYRNTLFRIGASQEEIEEAWEGLGNLFETLVAKFTFMKLELSAYQRDHEDDVRYIETLNLREGSNL